MFTNYFNSPSVPSQTPSPHIIQILPVLDWQLAKFREYCLFPLGHINIGIGQCKHFAHGRIFNLQKILAIELKVILHETKLQQSQYSVQALP